MSKLSDPSWLPPLPSLPRSPQEHMALAIEVALASAKNGGGPFGAVIAASDGRAIALGWNDVLRSRDSTAHAEVVAIRRAQIALAAHRLDACALYTSCAPCIQCYGAVYWSGLSRVYAAARKEDAEAIGFEEGPAMAPLWQHARVAKGIEYVADFERDERALAPLRTYADVGGVNYSRAGRQRTG